MTELRWGPRPGAFVFGGVLLATGIGWMFVASNFGDRLIAGAVMVVVLGAMFVGWRMRQRLQASVHGLVVGGIGGRREIPWTQVRRIEVVSSKRMGTTNQSLEVDVNVDPTAGTESDELLVFGRMDLGTDPAEVAAALTRIRTGG